MQYMKKNNLLFPLHSFGGAVFLGKNSDNYCVCHFFLVILHAKLYKSLK